MYGLPRAIPDVDVFLSLAPEEVAGVIVVQRNGRFHEKEFHPENLKGEIWGSASEHQPQYPRDRKSDVQLALSGRGLG